MKKQGALVISLDFELFWGIADFCDEKHENSTMLKVYQVVPRLLNLFEKYGIHATWATVGALMASDGNDFISYLPRTIAPQTEQIIKKLGLPEGNSNYSQKILFAPDLVKEVSMRSGQQIGTHTYSHYYCDISSSTPVELGREIACAQQIACKAGYSLKSIVFPRNQVQEAYVEALKEFGIRIYRGIEKSRFQTVSEKHPRLRTILWYADHYIPVLGRHSFDSSEVLQNGMANVRKSRFFKPFREKYSILEPIKLQHYKREMLYAAKHGEIYHLCWHPHNFAHDTETNFSQLESLLAYFKMLNHKYGMLSMTMEEAAQYCTENNTYER